MKHCIYCGVENTNKLLKFCVNCYYSEVVLKNKAKPYHIKQISDKKKARLIDTGGEKELFRSILIKRQSNGNLTCEVCNNQFKVQQAQPVCFAHILSKAMYPQYRLFENNIKIVCPDLNLNSCHHELDKIITGNKREIEQEILDGKTINLQYYARKSD